MLAPLGFAWNGDAFQQTLCIGVQRIFEYLNGRSGFYDLAAVHDLHPAGDASDDAKIMGDHNHSHIELFLQ